MEDFDGTTLEPCEWVWGPSLGASLRQERKKQPEASDDEGWKPTWKEREQKIRKYIERYERHRVIYKKRMEEKTKESTKGKYAESHHCILCMHQIRARSCHIWMGKTLRSIVLWNTYFLELTFSHNEINLTISFISYQRQK